MPQGHRAKSDAEKVADIVRDAGGRVVGRTRLQKISYLLEITGVGEGFPFEYRHYGPYSEELADAAQFAQFLDLIREDEYATSWGGFYSVFSSLHERKNEITQPRRELCEVASSADAVELELAATAAFLSLEGATSPWEETATLKPEKAKDGRLERAKVLYRRLCAIATPVPLPDIA